jgi:hypothetical protein
MAVDDLEHSSGDIGVAALGHDGVDEHLVHAKPVVGGQSKPRTETMLRISV